MQEHQRCKTNKKQNKTMAGQTGGCIERMFAWVWYRGECFEPGIAASASRLQAGHQVQFSRLLMATGQAASCLFDLFDAPTGESCSPCQVCVLVISSIVYSMVLRRATIGTAARFEEDVEFWRVPTRDGSANLQRLQALQIYVYS